MGITDKIGRNIDYARISLTDRCNYRCVYCMPEEGVPLLRHEEIMRYEEIFFLSRALQELGVKKIRFTGGEPLLRKGIVPFLIDFHKGFPDMALSITTNASLLSGCAWELAQIGLSGMNVSLDTLAPDKFRNITRVGEIKDVLEGIDCAIEAGIANIKTNTVLVRGFNDEELPRILDYAWSKGIVPRVIEFMPLGDDVWEKRKFIGAPEILEMLRDRGDWRLQSPAGNTTLPPAGPARYYVDLATGNRVGVIEAVSNHFCASCNRLRITPSGGLLPCLFARDEISLLHLIRHRDGEGLKEAILHGMNFKPNSWEETRDGKARMSGIGG